MTHETYRPNTTLWVRQLGTESGPPGAQLWEILAGQQESDCELRIAVGVECALRWRDGRGGNGGEEEALGLGKRQRTPLRVAVQRFPATVPWCSAARPPVGCMEDSNFSVPGPGGKPLGLARPVPARAPALYSTPLHSTQRPMLCVPKAGDSHSYTKLHHGT